MVLHNVNSFCDNSSKHIHIHNGVIKAIDTGAGVIPGATHVYFENAMAFPGLINSHDHLDFNLFKQTGNRIYNNYTEWGTDIHSTNKEEINTVMAIPYELRLQWGLYKNLIAGVTTVVEHGKKINVSDDLITVFQNCYNLHSVGFEKGWQVKLNRPFVKNIPFVIHAAEGTDTAANKEIDRLLKWNFLKRKLIAVHGVAMNTKQANGFAALVWCPVSNFFLLNKTAAVEELKNSTAVVLGTDSTLTAGWNIWDHLRLAREQNALTDLELFNAVTKTPAAVWQLQAKGDLCKNAIADIVVAKVASASAASFYGINPDDILLVLHKGDIRLFDASMKEQLFNSGVPENKFTKILLGTATKYVWGNVAELLQQIKKYYPGASFPVIV
jgi:cytosine/adenosine deaminase-related metal-dependent hydrolase